MDSEDGVRDTRHERRVTWAAGLLILAAVFLVVTSQVHALTGDIKKDPADVVKRYLSLDSKGARLDAMSWETVKPLVAWKDEPAWGQVVVVSTYQVVDDVKQWRVLSTMEVIIPVEFHVLGSVYYETASFYPDVQVKRADYRVKAIKGLWRIMEPMLPPHVSQKRMVGFVRQAALDETDQSKVARLGELRDALKRAGNGANGK